MARVSPGWLAGVLLRLLPSVALLGLFEAGLRAFELPRFDACWYVDDDFWQPDPDPELGWLYRPGAVVVGATINERGLRGPVLPAEKAPGHYRILFIGDSTCFGLRVALEESFAGLSSRLLQAASPERVVEYEIGALPGYSSHHSRVLTRRMLAQRPDLVVFYVGGHNDHSRARYYRDGDIPARLARRHAGWHGIRTLLLLENVSDHSYRRFFRKLRSPAARARVPPWSFRENVQDMVRRARASGAVPLVLSPPFSEHLRRRHPIVPSYQEALRQVAREEGALFVDLDEPFRAHPDDEVYLADRFHFTARGHAIAAQAIAAAVRDGSR
jgi:lysophospholipase L1-like esterase